MPVSPKATILGQSKNNHYYQINLKSGNFGALFYVFVHTYLDFCNKEGKNHATYK